MRPRAPEERLVVALDVAHLDQAHTLVKTLRPLVTWFKVGLELYSVAGPAAVEMVKAEGARVFVDLKLHDIPHTVARATAALGRLGADMISLHAAGGRTMMAEAVAATRSAWSSAVDAAGAAAASSAAAAGGDADLGGTGKGPGPILLGVTVLTSLGEEELGALGVSRGLAEQVVALARLALDAGLHGWVASAREAALLRKEFGPDPVIVTPGIRPSRPAPAAGAGAAPRGGRPGSDDQVRVATPALAVAAGADWLVVGRPITRAPDPLAAARAVVEEMRGETAAGAGAWAGGARDGWP
ncbi:MAG: orotidine 5'-phosphate decarboxylase [Bacillota bacterium]|nr:orotidine 5'-phosphate decarboxylase [Bacillota bacterium]